MSLSDTWHGAHAYSPSTFLVPPSLNNLNCSPFHSPSLRLWACANFVVLSSFFDCGAANAAQKLIKVNKNLKLNSKSNWKSKSLSKYCLRVACCGVASGCADPSNWLAIIATIRGHFRSAAVGEKRIERPLCCMCCTVGQKVMWRRLIVLRETCLLKYKYVYKFLIL